MPFVLVIEAVLSLLPSTFLPAGLWAEAAAASSSPPRAVQGRLDVSSRDVSESTIPLSGEWELYFDRLLEPELFTRGAPTGSDAGGVILTPRYAPVPGSWTSIHTEEGPLPRHGAATYRLVITGLPEAGSTPWALYIPYARTAYRLWVNGRLVASSGTVSLRPEEMRPHYRPLVVPLPGAPAPPDPSAGDPGAGFVPGSDKPPDPVQIVMHVSNGHFRAGGIPKDLVFGPVDQVVREHQQRLALQMFVTGALGLMALYFLLAHFLWRPDDRSILYFALLSGVIAVRSFFTGEMPFAVFIPDMSWHVLLRIEYVTSYMGPLAFALFLHALFPQDVSRIMRDIWVAIGIAGTVLSVVLPVRYTSLTIPYYTVLVITLIPYICFVLVQAVRNKREGADLTLVGGFFFVAAVVLSIFHYNQLWIHLDWVPFGLFPLLVSQAVALSRRSAVAFRQARELAHQNGLLLEETRRRLAERNRLYRLLVQQDEKSRRSIAELLHGRVQAHLFTASQSAAQAAATVENDPGEAARLMHFVHDMVEQVRKREIREASHRLHPAAIRAGLIGALESLCSGRHHELDVEFSVDPALTFLDDPGGLRLHETVRLGFYRIVEEALANVECHASARRVRVSLRLVTSPVDPSSPDRSLEPGSRNAWIELVVDDDGVGFDPETTNFGLGLQLIAARAADLNGRWDVTSRPGEGTRLRVVAPLEFA